MTVDPEQPPGEPGSGAPTETQPPQTDWEQRFKDTQAWGNQAHEQLKALQENPEKFLEFTRQYQADLLAEEEPPEPEYEPLEPEPGEDPRVTKHDEWIAQQEARQANDERQAQWDGWEKYIKEQAPEGRALQQWEIDALKLACVDPNGYPIPSEKADAVLTKHIEGVDAWLDEQVTARKKPAPRATHVPGGPGTPANAEPPTGAEQRQAKMLADIQAHESGA